MHKEHRTHEGILLRLKRAEGHLRKVIEMVEKEAPCVQVAQQMQAVAKAIDSAKSTFIYDHIENCLDKVMDENGSINRQELREFKEIAKYI